MRGNSHVRFLGEEAVATLPPYPTPGRKSGSISHTPGMPKMRFGSLRSSFTKWAVFHTQEEGNSGTANQWRRGWRNGSPFWPTIETQNTCEVNHDRSRGTDSARATPIDPRCRGVSGGTLAGQPSPSKNKWSNPGPGGRRDHEKTGKEWARGNPTGRLEEALPNYGKRPNAGGWRRCVAGETRKRGPRSTLQSCLLPRRRRGMQFGRVRKGCRLEEILS